MNQDRKYAHNASKTCWNCPAAVFKGNVDFRACGQTKDEIKAKTQSGHIMIECSRRPELGFFEPTISFDQCSEWIMTEYGLMLKNMRVSILGIDGYLGWALALKLAKLGYTVSGLDNLRRRDNVSEKGSFSLVPIESISGRIEAVKETLGVEIKFCNIDLRNRKKLRMFLEKNEPEAIIHYAECPSAPYSMVDSDHAIDVQNNNVLGTLGLLFEIRDIVPESCLIKLGTLGEYGSPLTGRPLFEGFFPSDAVLNWNDREWSLGGELTPRDPVSFYHISKVQDTFNIYEACKYWWLRAYDIMQGVIYGVHTEEVSFDPRLRTRFDIDEWFGTVVNRFISQAVLGIPLTVYGKGGQIRGFIALEDAMECMVRLINSPPEPGEYAVVNQVSGLYKVSSLAKRVAVVAASKFDLTVQIQRIENPRIETEWHPYEVISENLPNKFGFVPKITPEIEIERTLKLISQPEIKQRLDAVKNVVIPKTWWNGEKKISGTLETYKPEDYKEEGYIPKLHLSVKTKTNSGTQSN